MKGFWTKKLPAVLLTLTMLVSLVPAAAAASADLTYEVDADDYVYLDADDFWELFDDQYDGDYDFEYLKFTDYDDFDEYGYFVADDYEGDEYDDLDNDELGDSYFYYDYRDTEDWGDFDLDTLKFVTYDDADSDTLSFDFTLYGESNKKLYGSLEIDIDGGSGSSTKGGTITYKVKPGSSVDFNSSDFSKVLKNEYSTSSLRYVEFDKPSSTAFSDGTLYADYGKSGSESFTRSDLADYDFYYSSSSYGDYALDDLSFVAKKTFEDDVTLTFTAYGPNNRSVEGTVKITASGSSSGSSGDGDIEYEADAGDKVSFDEDDFEELFSDEYDSYWDSDFSYVVFDDSDNLDDCGKLYAYNYKDSKTRLYEDDLDDYYFYYDDDDVTHSYDYCLTGMYYQVDSGVDDETVTLDFTAYGEDDDDYVEGTLTITIGDGGKGTSSKKGDINYKASAGKETAVDADDFNDYFQEEYSSFDFKYLVFTGSSGLNTASGAMYTNYGSSKHQQKFTASSLEDAYFYYDEDDIDEDDDDCYLLDDLSFVAAKTYKSPVTLEFRAYYSSSRYVDGTVVFGSTGSDSGSTAGSYYVGSVRYATTPGKNVQINANDIARFFSKNCPGYTLQYVLLTGVPANGSLYYNYYGASKYGTSTKAQLTTSNASGQVFYASPANTSQFALTELTYIPSGSNYCAAIPFTAYGTGGRSVSGAILISVTSAAVSEVYGVTPKNTAVSFPASSIYSAVLNATGSALSSIQLLSLPSYAAGIVYADSSYTLANTTTRYSYNSISQLQFVPNTGYTGSVEIPYVALNSSGTAIAAGTFSLGVVNAKKTFTDVSSSTWCYKYVTELSDAGVIDGYAGGSFKPNNTVTYGAALKLIMLAAGYPEQKPTTSNVFSGYLAKAKADGLVSGNINLSKPISRLAVAQIAAKAMKLSTSGLSGVKPFTDTSDPYVQALNAAGIVEGYFANGTSTFKPNNTLTRGQVSAIVWRMRNYNK